MTELQYSKRKQTARGNAYKTTADRWFSKYIRRRDADPDGYCKCITCSKVFKWQDMDCGHFVSRDRLSVRFNEQNAHAQCKACNRFKAGQQYEHGKAIDKLYGKDTADALVALGKVRGGKYPEMWWRDIAKEYKEKERKLNKGGEA